MNAPDLDATNFENKTDKHHTNKWNKKKVMNLSNTDLKQSKQTTDEQLIQILKNMNDNLWKLSFQLELLEESIKKQTKTNEKINDQLEYNGRAMWEQLERIADSVGIH